MTVNKERTSNLLVVMMMMILMATQLQQASKVSLFFTSFQSKDDVLVPWLLLENSSSSGPTKEQWNVTTTMHGYNLNNTMDGSEPNDVTLSMLSSPSLFLPTCDPKTKAKWIECIPPSPSSIDVILNVYKRENLREQLNMIVVQTLQPSHIWVIQNEHHYDISSIVNEWNDPTQPFPFNRSTSSINDTITMSPNDTTTTTTTIPTSEQTSSHQRKYHRPHLHWIHFQDSDSMYHGRFHLAYAMSKARYVSFWDDDLTVGSSWLEHTIDFLQFIHDKAVVSCGGRHVQQLPIPDNDWEVQYGIDPDLPLTDIVMEWSGGKATQVDFTVQHHTLRRDLLRWYLGSSVYTYATGEDSQLSWALQQRGIPAYALTSKHHRRSAAWAGADIGMGSNGPYASWKRKSQEPRLWLLCRLVHEGMQFPHCTNCHNTSIVQECLHHFEQTGSTMRHRRKRQRRKQIMEAQKMMQQTQQQ